MADKQQLCRYFRRLQKRYAAHTDQEDPHTSGNNTSGTARTQPPTEDPSTSFPIICVNLLKTYQQNELLLTEHFTKVRTEQSTKALYNESRMCRQVISLLTFVHMRRE